MAGIMHWAVAKLTGMPSIGQSCRDAVVGFLARNDIEVRTLNYVIGEPSFDRGFSTRVYFGDGTRASQRVSYLLSVDESLGSVSIAAIVKSADKNVIESLKAQWGADPITRGFPLWSFLSNRLGTVEQLNQR